MAASHMIAQKKVLTLRHVTCYNVLVRLIKGAIMKCSCGALIDSNDMFNRHEVDLGHAVDMGDE